MNEGPSERPFAVSVHAGVMTSCWCSTVMRTRERGAKPAVSIHRPGSFIWGRIITRHGCTRPRLEGSCRRIRWGTTTT